MSTRRIIAGTRLLLDIAYWFGLIGTVGLALWIVISPLVMRGDRSVDLSVPVAVGSGPLRPVHQLQVDTIDALTVERAVLVTARGELRVQTTDWLQQFLPNLVSLIAAAAVLWVIQLTRAVVRSVAEGSPFTETNSSRIRRIGVMLLILGAILPVMGYLISGFVINRLPLDDVDLTATFDLGTEAILAGFLVLVLASVFERGVELERDRALTV